jgi:hypothetical protein
LVAKSELAAACLELHAPCVLNTSYAELAILRSSAMLSSLCLNTLERSLGIDCPGDQFT